MPAPETWTINKETGGPDGALLNGFVISRTAVQTSISPPGIGSSPKATVFSTEPPITFDPFDYEGLKFNITIDTFHYEDKDEPHGSWSTRNPPEGVGEEGGWTAQAGGGVDAKAEGAAAADAS